MRYEITKTQTTYLKYIDHAEGHRGGRIHYKNKAEFHIPEKHFDKLQVLDVHPLLQQYQELRVELYFYEALAEPDSFLEECAQYVDEATSGWRNINEYINPHYNATDLLRSRHGLFFRGPVSIARGIREIFESQSVRTSSIQGGVPNRSVRLLLMEPNYVIAEDFEFIEGLRAK